MKAKEGPRPGQDSHRRRAPGLSALLASLAVASCAGTPRAAPVPPPPPMPDAAAATPNRVLRLPYSALVPRSALSTGFWRDGDQLVIRFTQGEPARPLSGVKANIRCSAGAISLVSDAQGRVTFPVRRQLLDEDCPMEFVKPPGVATVSMSLASTGTFRCDRVAQGLGGVPAVPPDELAGWP